MKYIFSVVAIFTLSMLLLNAIELSPIPIKIEFDAKKAELGKKLFVDPILSKDKTLSCLSCHNLQTNGADTVAFTTGIDGMIGDFNTPTVYNAVFNFRQFWDGRAKNLEDQALGPIVNPVEMGNSIDQVLRDLKANSKYHKYFNDIYEDGITKENLAEVLGEFGKILITPNSKFDNYLRGDESAISSSAKRGYHLFKRKGCVSCHNGVNIGGNLYNKFGIYKDITMRSMGRYAITKQEEDKYVFKVPSLRNVAITAPYMHDGRARSLKEAVNMMSEYQLGRPMKEEELLSIVSFLETLTGELPDSIKDINVTQK